MGKWGFIDIRELLRYEEFIDYGICKGFRRVGLQDLFLDYLRIEKW
jgi:hypothetical protein